MGKLKGIDLSLAQEAKRCQESDGRWLTPDVQHWYFYNLSRLVSSAMLDVRILASYDLILCDPGTGKKVKVPFATFVDRDCQRVYGRWQSYLRKLHQKAGKPAAGAKPANPPQRTRKRPRPVTRKRPS